jgi:hypothetical protein
MLRALRSSIVEAAPLQDLLPSPTSPLRLRGKYNKEEILLPAIFSAMEANGILQTIPSTLPPANL